jgi:hypothetical protein
MPLYSYFSGDVRRRLEGVRGRFDGSDPHTWAVGSSLWARPGRLFPWAQATKPMWLAPRPNKV